MNAATLLLRHHVSGAIARGEAEPIWAQEAPRVRVDTVHGHNCTCHQCAPQSARKASKP